MSSEIHKGSSRSGTSLGTYLQYKLRCRKKHEMCACIKYALFIIYLFFLQLADNKMQAALLNNQMQCQFGNFGVFKLALQTLQ